MPFCVWCCIHVRVLMFQTQEADCVFVHRDRRTPRNKFSVGQYSNRGIVDRITKSLRLNSTAPRSYRQSPTVRTVNRHAKVDDAAQYRFTEVPPVLEPVSRRLAC